MGEYYQESTRDPQRGGILSRVNQRSSAWGNIIRSQLEILSVVENYQESTRDTQRGGTASNLQSRDWYLLSWNTEENKNNNGETTLIRRYSRG